jgi:hypothetical protein
MMGGAVGAAWIALACFILAGFCAYKAYLLTAARCFTCGKRCRKTAVWCAECFRRREINRDVRL